MSPVCVSRKEALEAVRKASTDGEMAGRAAVASQLVRSNAEADQAVEECTRALESLKERARQHSARLDEEVCVCACACM
jgi:hypothetical protein